MKKNQKINTLTDERLDKLEKVAQKQSYLLNLLRGLEGEDNISTIMFQIGIIYNELDILVDDVSNLVEEHRGNDLPAFIHK
jgi:hypothetical protein